MMIAQDPATQRLVVLGAIEGSPADRAGVMKGDMIESVNGVSTRGWTTERIAKTLRGREGTVVNVKVWRRRVEPRDTRAQRVLSDPHPIHDLWRVVALQQVVDCTRVMCRVLAPQLTRVTNQIPGVPGRPEPRIPNQVPVVESKRVALTRGRVDISPVSAAIVADEGHSYGYIRLAQFSLNAPREMVRLPLPLSSSWSSLAPFRSHPRGPLSPPSALISCPSRPAHAAPSAFHIPLRDTQRKAVSFLEGAGVEGYIMDLRGNPGGVVDAGIDVASVWLDGPSPVMRIQGRDGARVSGRGERKRGRQVTE